MYRNAFYCVLSSNILYFNTKNKIKRNLDLIKNFKEIIGMDSNG